MRLGSSCLPLPLWSPTHTYTHCATTPAEVIQDKTSLSSLFSGTFQLDYSFKQFSSEFLEYYATSRFEANAALLTLYVCACYCSMSAHALRQQTQETVVSPNNTLPLSPAVLPNKQVSVCQTQTRLQLTRGQHNTESPRAAYM